MKIPFNVKFRPQIESGEYKVFALEHEEQEARIVCWDNKGDYPIIALVDNEPEKFDKHGRIPGGNRGGEFSLFIITPEPEMSEDERIRKILIHIVKGACYKYGIKYIGDEIGQEKLLAYLEKQKEQNSSALQNAFERSVKDYSLEEKRKASDYADSILPTSIAYGESEEEYKLHKIIEAAFIAGQKEQKPESCDCSRDEESYTNGIHHVLMNPEAYGLIKQKSAEWSEEDERTLESFLGWLQGSMGEKTYSSWLKSLPERFSLKPKQEWSEEDEKMRNLIVAIFEVNFPNGVFKANEDITDRHLVSTYEIIAWLKSLRPQPHWKPSKEQMEALKDVIDRARLTCRQQVQLESLYSDLKNL